LDHRTNILQITGRPEPPPATQNVSRKSSGTKIRKLGANFKFLFKGKISLLNRFDVYV